MLFEAAIGRCYLLSVVGPPKYFLKVSNTLSSTFTERYIHASRSPSLHFKMASILPDASLPNILPSTNHLANEQPPLRKCAGRCQRKLLPSEFINLRDPTKTTQRYLLCQNSNNAEVPIDLIS